MIEKQCTSNRQPSFNSHSEALSLVFGAARDTGKTKRDQMAPKPIVDLPPGKETISVKMINPVNFGPSVIKRFMTPPVPGLETFKSAPSLSFVLEHPSGRKLVWDLGIRKDYGNYAPRIATYIPTTNYDIQCEKNVIDILQEHGVEGKDIEAVIWRQVMRTATPWRKLISYW